ncbi:MAG: pyridoxal-phosphate dependent enzyme [Theionarchaea archaeon]|nr:pyridoxal-phosphate dependent enzyme [Theionarchaea archaeon]
MIVCSRCHREYEGLHWQCECGGPLERREDVCFQKEGLPPVCSLWRYEQYLGTEKKVSFNEGMTPIVLIDDCYYKMDFLFPTGSFKDRGTTVMMSELAKSIDCIVEDSSGNAGASVAAYAARADVTAEIYVPAYASKGKISQIEAFGAHICSVEGTREDTKKAALKRADTMFYASHQWNPHFLEGMKTAAYEIAEQFNWDAPDTVVMPIGSGSLFYGVYKGFNHLFNSGVIAEIPHLIGVQPELCSPVYNEVNSLPPQCGKSIAEGLLVENPPRLKEISTVIKKHGDIVVVSEEEIRRGLKRAVKMGLFIEPTSAVVMAALERMHLSKSTVALLTGSGLKAADELRTLL